MFAITNENVTTHDRGVTRFHFDHRLFLFFFFFFEREDHRLLTNCSNILISTDGVSTLYDKPNR